MWQSSEGELPRSVDGLLERIIAEPILSGALASIGLALGLELAGRSKAARFVGLWAPTLLLIGLYRQGAARAAANAGQRADVDRNAEQLPRERFQGGCAATPTEETIDTSFRFPHKAK